jgi:hypothetical protein
MVLVIDVCGWANLQGSLRAAIYSRILGNEGSKTRKSKNNKKLK